MRVMRGLFKKRGKWWVDFCAHGQRIRRPASADLKEAEKILMRLRMKASQQRAAIVEGMTFTDLAKEYLEEYSRPMKASSRTDEGLLANHLVPYFGDHYIGEITRGAWAKYRATRISQRVIDRKWTVSERTVNREAALLRSMLSFAVEKEYLDANPLAKLKMFKEEPRRRVLSLGQLREIIDKAKPPLKHVIVIALNTGMRKDEILKLTWDRVNFDSRLITVIKTKSKRPRDIWMNDALLDLMLHLQAPAGPVFPNRLTGKPMRDIKQPWGSLIKRLGIEDFRFHDLRRCWSTYAKGDMVTRKQGMGHSSITMTADYTVPLEAEMMKMYTSFQMWENDEKVVEFPGTKAL